MNKLLQIIQYTFNGFINTFYNPVKALENEQKKIEQKYLLAGGAYQKAKGELNVQKGNLSDLYRKIEVIEKNIDKQCALNGNNTMQLAQELVLLNRKATELQHIIEENEYNLNCANNAIGAMAITIQRNESKLSNLHLKQKMNQTAKAMLSILSIDKNNASGLSFDSVDKQLTDDQRRIVGEANAIKKLNVTNLDEISIEQEAIQLLENRKQQQLLIGEIKK